MEWGDHLLITHAHIHTHFSHTGLYFINVLLYRKIYDIVSFLSDSKVFQRVGYVVSEDIEKWA